MWRVEQIGGTEFSLRDAQSGQVRARLSALLVRGGDGSESAQLEFSLNKDAQQAFGKSLAALKISWSEGGLAAGIETVLGNSCAWPDLPHCCRVAWSETNVGGLASRIELFKGLLDHCNT